MIGVNEITEAIVNLYKDFQEILPPWMKVFINLLLLVIIVVLYAIFFWKFYRFISKKNILELNLNQYNKSKHPFLNKIFASFFYFIEYILIMPIFIFFWFGIFTVFLILLTEGIEISTILIVSAVIVGAARMTSYYKEDLSKEISKLFPLTLLAVAMTTPGFFNFEKILERIAQIPSFTIEILYYLIFIIVLEIILRAFNIIFSLFEVNSLDEENTEEKIPKNTN